MSNGHNLHNCLYNMHDVKYISDESRLEAPTVANLIQHTLVQSSRPTHTIPATI